MNLRNFHSSRRMTRRSSTCRSALLMVLPKRRNNLYISILPGVLSVASVHQRLWMARRALLMAGAGASGAGLGAAGSRSGVRSGLGRSGLSFHGRLGRSGLGRSGLSFHGRLGRSGLGRIDSRGIHAKLPHPAQALVEPVRAGRCASPARLRRRVPPRADPWPPSPSQRRCLSAVRQPRSRRRAGARAPRTRRESPSQSLCFSSK